MLRVHQVATLVATLWLAGSWLVGCAADESLEGEVPSADTGAQHDAGCTDCACTEDSQCSGGTCLGGTCVQSPCDDGRHNGDETAVDCGGGQCDPCEVGDACATASDCVTGLCLQLRCVPPTCDDGEPNGSETDEDCGGLCSPCVDGRRCLVASDCASNFCDPEQRLCDVPRCDDGLQNGAETDTDCGGDLCDPCALGGGCAVNTDCQSRFCRAFDGSCRDPACDDGIVNGTETDTDCGGACLPCSTGQVCGVDSDCSDEFCHPDELVCREPACDDGYQNGPEMGADCGGGCAGCAVGAACAVDADCASFFCGASSSTCGDSAMSWATSSWSACSAPCDGGTHSRTVTGCQRQTEAGVDPVPNEHCEGAPQPALSGECNADACTYSWATGSWGTCSASCGGGNQTRSVTCRRDADHTDVADALCSGQSKPAASQTCNTQSCCSTDALSMADKGCVGSTNDIIAWVPFHFGLDDGSPANRTECQNQCTTWAINNSVDEWCCELGEDSTTGTSWSCSIHSQIGTRSRVDPDIRGSYVGYGRCN